ncbi:plasmid transfer protein TraA [Streptomyces buecherae]|uniref:plasmid transfer protein TraA n=1 Tax=Streptomyces buecherae TaxID=2763006 RepID=UPI00364BD089
MASTMGQPSGAAAGGAAKPNKFSNAGAAAGGFIGAMGSTFVPPINVTVNRNTTTTLSQGRERPQAQSLLPEPDFTSPAQVRNYCNTLRAASITLAIEVAMAAEILKGVLAVVPDPDGRLGGSRMRAGRVARKLQKSADELRSAGVAAAATYAVFQQQYEEEINRVRHRARRPQTPRIDWTRQ